jgi:Uma2 family endonuclease
MNVLTAPPSAKLITGDELLSMGHIGPCELIDGRIVMGEPAGFEHGRLESNLASELRMFVRRHKLGWVTSGEAGVYTHRNPDWVRGVDVAFISKARLPHGPTHKFLEVAPELIVEVMSPDDTWAEVRAKIAEYFAIGVLWVWVVAPKERALVAHYPNGETQRFGEADRLHGEGILDGFVLPIAELFES